MAIVSVRRSRLDELAAAGSPAAVAALRLRGEPEMFLATVQVGITVIGAAAGAFGGAAFAEDLEPLVEAIPVLSAWPRQVAFGGVVLGIAYLSVVLGELVPKSLALRHAETYALLVSGSLLRLSRLARPVVWLLSASSNAILRLFGHRTTFTEARLSSEEVRRMIEEATRTGEVDMDLGAVAARALALEPLRAKDVMIHRRFVHAVDGKATVGEARRRMLDAGHMTVPVMEGPEREVVGYVSWRDLLGSSAAGDGRLVRTLARAPWHVPAAMPAAALLREFRQRRMHLAFVVDEYGETVGMVTLRDLLDEFVGEFLGEGETPPMVHVRRQPDGSALVDGTATIHEVNRELGLRLPVDGEAVTVGGLCAVLAGGRIPEIGETLLAADGFTLVPVETSPRRVRMVSIRGPGTVSDTSSPSPPG